MDFNLTPAQAAVGITDPRSLVTAAIDYIASADITSALALLDSADFGDNREANSALGDAIDALRDGDDASHSLRLVLARSAS